MKESNWISVKNKLPDLYPHSYYGGRSDKLLIYGTHNSNNILDASIFIGYMVKGNVFYSDEFGRCDQGIITHWQYLPLKPTN